MQNQIKTPVMLLADVFYFSFGVVWLLFTYLYLSLQAASYQYGWNADKYATTGVLEIKPDDRAVDQEVEIREYREETEKIVGPYEREVRELQRKYDETKKNHNEQWDKASKEFTARLLRRK